MIREVKFKEDVREGMQKGAEKVFKAVASTMGAKGKLVGIQNRFDENYLTKDGFYTSKTIFLEDPVENMGASMIKEVAQKSSFTGDGTTTATVLTYKMFEKGYEAIKKGANSVDIKKGIQLAVKEVVKHLKDNAIPVKGKDMLRQVATVSANNDEEIGKLIAEAQEGINEGGIIDVEEASGLESRVEIMDGMRIDQGFISPYFVTNPEKMICEYKNAFVLVYHGTLSTMEQMTQLLDFCLHKDAPILIVALEIEQEAGATLVVNKRKNNLKAVAVRAPGVGGTRKTWLDDIAASCGAITLGENVGASLEDFNQNMLGTAKKIKVTQYATEIIGGGAIESDLEERIATIKNQIKTAKKTDNVGLHKERLAKLDGGVATIHIGYTTDVEAREKKDLFEDAIAAVKSATEEGVVAGGGTSLVEASVSVGKLIPHISFLNRIFGKKLSDKQIGLKIVRDALREPLLTIMGNAGLDGEEVLISVLGTNIPNLGFNLNTEEYCDMVKEGILDTVKVERMAVENSASVASLMLNMETIIHSVEETNNQK
jgi:chaperonin GroEL